MRTCYLYIPFVACLCSLRLIVDELQAEDGEGKEGRGPECVSLSWSADGQTLFAGFTDNLVRVWAVIA